jgi:hypothetical protein
MAVLAQDCAIFAPYVDITLHPVLDMEQAAAALEAGIEFNRSV